MRTINDYVGILEILLGLLTEKSVFYCEQPFEEVLKKHARLIGVFSHATPLSWLPVMATVGVEMAKAGGGSRVPLGVMDRFFYDFKPLRPLAQWITQSARPLGFIDLVEHFQSFASADLCLFPEGSNCFFGDPRDIQEFRSPRILELAIRTETPIFLGVHRGSENWAMSVPIPDSLKAVSGFLPTFAGQPFRTVESLTLPVVPKKMEKFSMLCSLYSPQLKSEELVKNRLERRKQLEIEADIMRARMKELLEKLDAMDASPAKVPLKPSGEPIASH